MDMTVQRILYTKRSKTSEECGPRVVDVVEKGVVVELVVVVGGV